MQALCVEAGQHDQPFGACRQGQLNLFRAGDARIRVDAIAIVGIVREDVQGVGCAEGPVRAAFPSFCEGGGRVDAKGATALRGCLKVRTRHGRCFPTAAKAERDSPQKK